MYISALNIRKSRSRRVRVRRKEGALDTADGGRGTTGVAQGLETCADTTHQMLADVRLAKINTAYVRAYNILQMIMAQGKEEERHTTDLTCALSTGETWIGRIPELLSIRRP